MALYDRIIGRDEQGRRVLDRIVPEVFATVVAEYARGKLNAGQALALMEALKMELDQAEVAEVTTLLATVTGTPEQRLARYIEIRDVLSLARLQAPGYCRPSEVRTRLGV